jgi:hypothetical protein
LLCLAAGTVAVIAKEEPAKSAETPTTKPVGKPVNKFCAVETEHEIDPAVTIVHNGKIIGFCCADCIKDFKKDPDKYVKGMK